MRFHLVSLPHTNTTDDFSACAFTEKVRKFAIMMMSLGHEVFLYGGEKNEAPCTEHVVCLGEAQRLGLCGGKHYTQAPFNPQLPAWVTFNQNAILGITARQQKEDFVCVIGGWANKAINDALPHLTFVEFGAGYSGTFAKYIVWESYAWMHTVYGCREPSREPNNIDGHFFHAVIPGYFEMERFPFSEQKEDYFLYVGRLTARKGYSIAVEVCKHLGKKLILAGQPDGELPDYGEYVGVIGPEERGRLMSRAKALFVPTTYIEPFGNVAVEAQGSGTPVICTDWGAMTETVIEGKTGFHCRTMQEFIDATRDVAKLDPIFIQRHAQENYSLQATAPKYDKYFRRLLQLWGKGYYELREEDAHAAEEGLKQEDDFEQYSCRSKVWPPTKASRGYSLQDRRKRESWL